MQLIPRPQQYGRPQATADIMAGIVVAVLIIPQAMAHAAIAGLPAQMGLYAAIIPLILYGVFGRSRVLSVGTAAVVSLLVFAGLSGRGASGAELMALAMVLALLVGLVQIAIGLLRLGQLANRIPHAVIKGFIAGAVVAIIVSQIGPLLGSGTHTSRFAFSMLWFALTNLADLDPATAIIGLLSLGALFYTSRAATSHLKTAGLSEPAARLIPKGAPLLLLLVMGGLVYLGGISSVATVGEIPRGLPRPRFPSVSVWDWLGLTGTAVIIAFIGFIESYSVGSALLGPDEQPLDGNREFMVLGVCNLASGFSGGYPVAGSFSRSALNKEEGAVSGVASLVTATLLIVGLLALTSLLQHVPMTVLAVIIIVAVIPLLNWKYFKGLWSSNRPQAWLFLVTFSAVLVVGPELGLLGGIIAGVLMRHHGQSREEE